MYVIRIQPKFFHSTLTVTVVINVFSIEKQEADKLGGRNCRDGSKGQLKSKSHHIRC